MALFVWRGLAFCIHRKNWLQLACSIPLIWPLAATPQATPPSNDDASDVARLRSRHAQLATQLARSDFGRPLVLESEQADNRIEGAAFAVVDAPFAAVSQIFSSPQDWCGILLLHLNTRRCQVRPTAAEGSPAAAAEGQPPALLAILLGKKVSMASINSLNDTFALNLRFEPVLVRADYLSTRLTAAQGPVGTRDYRISLEAIALNPRQTFLHFRYAYGFGLAAKLAMQAYLATFGSQNIGFTLRPAVQGQAPRAVGGLRGAVERNTMRYFLAMEVYLQTRDLPPSERQDQRLRDWFDATEQYHAQLFEIDRETYLTVKRHDLRAQGS